MRSDTLVIGGTSLASRLIIGTGKFKDFETMKRAHEASGADMVTVAVQRVELDRSKESLLDWIDTKKMTLLPNTAGCYTAEDAVRTSHLAREACGTPLIKLEVIGDKKTLFPDNEGLLQATRELVKEGFVVLPYTSDDLIVPIGSGLGVCNPSNLRLIMEEITDLPVIVDAGVGTASDAAVTMELGADGILINTAIAGATDAVKMARAMKEAVSAGRLAYEAGRIPRKAYATASSPESGLV